MFRYCLVFVLKFWISGPPGPPGTPREGPRPPQQILKRCKVCGFFENYEILGRVQWIFSPSPWVNYSILGPPPPPGHHSAPETLPIQSRDFRPNNDSWVTEWSDYGWGVSFDWTPKTHNFGKTLNCSSTFCIFQNFRGGRGPSRGVPGGPRGQKIQKFRQKNLKFDIFFEI